MSDDDDWQKHYEERLASEIPMMQVLLDTPFKAFRVEGAVLAIDTATFGLQGFDRLGFCGF